MKWPRVPRNAYSQFPPYFKKMTVLIWGSITKEHKQCLSFTKLEAGLLETNKQS